MFPARNRSLQANPIPTIDLHGLLTSEAVIKTEKAFKAVLEEGGKSLRVIVGKGLHSKQRKAKLKPAVEKAMIGCAMLLMYNLRDLTPSAAMGLPVPRISIIRAS